MRAAPALRGDSCEYCHVGCDHRVEDMPGGLDDARTRTQKSPGAPDNADPLQSGAAPAIVSHMDNYGASLDLIFHALADPTRRAIVQRLGKGPATVTELAQPFAMALPSLMKHVGVLEVAGLLRSEKTGRVRTCVLERRQLAAVDRWLGEQRAVWQARYGNLDALLEQLNGEDDET